MQSLDNTGRQDLFCKGDEGEQERGNRDLGIINSYCLSMSLPLSVFVSVSVFLSPGLLFLSLFLFQEKVPCMIMSKGFSVCEEDFSQHCQVSFNY